MPQVSSAKFNKLIEQMVNTTLLLRNATKRDNDLIAKANKLIKDAWSMVTNFLFSDEQHHTMIDAIGELSMVSNPRDPRNITSRYGRPVWH